MQELTCWMLQHFASQQPQLERAVDFIVMDEGPKLMPLLPVLWKRGELAPEQAGD